MTAPMLLLFSLAPNVGGTAAKTPGGRDRTPSIRVRIRTGERDILVGGTDLRRRSRSGKNKIFPGRKRIRYRCSRLEGRARPFLIASIDSPGGPISLGETPRGGHGGSLHIVASPSERSCDVVQETGVEDYLAALIAKEMNGTWPLEALKAQAVAARTYALYKKKSSETAGGRHYHLESGEIDQVAGNLADVTSKTRAASESTAGEVLIPPSGKLRPTFFHARCGGRTILPRQAWKNRVDGYQEVTCPFCSGRDPAGYRGKVPLARFRRFLGWLGEKRPSPRTPPGKGIEILPDRIHRRFLGVRMGGEVFRFRKSLARRYFGRKVLPSNNFTVIEGAGGIEFRGRGLGHGVGMCQVGALHLARQGLDHKRILNHYFPRFTIERVY